MLADDLVAGNECIKVEAKCARAQSVSDTLRKCYCYCATHSLLRQDLLVDLLARKDFDKKSKSSAVLVQKRKKKAQKLKRRKKQQKRDPQGADDDDDDEEEGDEEEVDDDGCEDLGVRR